MSFQLPAVMQTATSVVTVAQFRRDFKVFADSAVYDDASISMYLQIASYFSPRRYGQWLAMAQELFAAHFLTIDRQDMLSTLRGGLPGQTTGPAVTKSIGGASISYAEYATIEGGMTGNSGHWNLTVYGKRYLRIARMAGAGPIQITGGGGAALGNTGYPYEITNPNGVPPFGPGQ
jgi:hypothetical protein